MTKLSEQLFLPLETLKNEKIVWEGGPSAKSFWAELYVVFAACLILSLIFWFFVTVFFFVIPSQEDCSKCDKKKTELSQEHQNPKATTSTSNKKETNNFPTIIYIFSTVSAILALLFVTGIIAKISLKTYWYVITNERVCIQQGVFEKDIVTIDLDKTISIKVSQSLIERIFNLNSIELIHAGLQFKFKNNSAFIQSPNVLKYLNVNDQVSSRVINEWLPRDNKNA